VLIQVLTAKEAPPAALDRTVFQQHVIVIDDVVEDCRELCGKAFHALHLGLWYPPKP